MPRSGRSRAPRLRRSRRSSSSASIACGGRSFVRAAASSTARGRPSSRAQISARRPCSHRSAGSGDPLLEHALDEERDGFLGAERVDGILLLAGDAQGCSARDEEAEARRGLEDLRERPGASASCSKLSITSRPAFRRVARRGSRAEGRSLLSRTATACAIAGSRRAGSRIESSATKNAPSGSSPARMLAASVASLVLPDPPGPVSVSTRVSRERVGDLLELALPPDERADRNGHVALGQRPPRERLVLAEDRLLQLAQLGARLEPELVE